MWLPEDGALAIKPVKMPLEDSAAILIGGVSALHFLKKAQTQAGQKVLVYGASKRSMKSLQRGGVYALVAGSLLQSWSPQFGLLSPAQGR